MLVALFSISGKFGFCFSYCLIILSADSFIGVRGFFISWAILCAISFHHLSLLSVPSLILQGSGLVRLKILICLCR